MKLLFLPLVMLALVAFRQPDPIDMFKWLTGSWEMKKANGSSRIESWKFHNENTLSGRGLNVKNQDSTLLESIELIFRDENFWYIPTVPDQNNASPVPFKLVSNVGFQFVFENPTHDFPQRIVYHLMPLRIHPEYVPSKGDTLQVRVEDLKGDGIDFTFYRQ